MSKDNETEGDTMNESDKKGKAIINNSKKKKRKKKIGLNDP